MVCLFCGVETNNPKYCTKSCAAKANNAAAPKRKKLGSCVTCNAPVHKARRKYCDGCKPSDLRGDLTLQEAIYKKHHKSSAFALVRTRARVVMSKHKQVCTRCGYDKHVEVCHIKAIREFSLGTKLSVINDPSNLMLLCPNCHWEHDNLN